MGTMMGGSETRERDGYQDRLSRLRLPDNRPGTPGDPTGHAARFSIETPTVLATHPHRQNCGIATMVRRWRQCIGVIGT
jgi:hypothetical protein